MADKVRIADSDRLDDLGAVAGASCWVVEGETRECGPFCQGEIINKDGDQIKVKLSATKNCTRPLKELLGANDVNAMEVHDLTKLMYIHPVAVSNVLKDRFIKCKIYTYVGAMLLVVNPFRDLKLTTSDKVLEYRAMEKSLVMESKGEPHVFAVCAKSLHMFQDASDINLSFVISGESGAGKTETTKHILSFFTCPADGSDKKDPISTAIMAGNPILEAFGNATTQRNNNSSRFGRLIRLFCTVEVINGVPAPKLHGGDVSPFLLEKSRITHAAEKERNYHVFYQLLKSVEPAKLQEYGIPADWKQLKYISKTKLFDVPNASKDHDQQEYKEVMEALVNIKCTPDQVEGIHRLVAAVLLLGEMECVGTEEDINPTSWDAVRKVEALMQISEDACDVGLFVSCAKKFRIIDGKETPCPLKVPEAQNSIHCMARAIFEALFMWNIDKINEAVKVEGDEIRWAAVLDIFGFEIMAVNSLEQLLINYANERLQQFFIANVFAKERVIYCDEGIDPSCVTFEDNQGFILVVDNEKSKEGPIGILAQLNSSCKNGSGTDGTFLNDCKQANYPKEEFEPGSGVKASEVFFLHHSMARVEYTVANFREKNMETLQRSRRV
jgi:myosin heavy subunit